VCVQEANLGKIAKSCTAQIKGSIFLKKYTKTILPTFIQNTVLGLRYSKLNIGLSQNNFHSDHISKKLGIIFKKH